MAEDCIHADTLEKRKKEAEETTLETKGKRAEMNLVCVCVSCAGVHRAQCARVSVIRAWAIDVTVRRSILIVHVVVCVAAAAGASAAAAGVARCRCWC